MIAYAALAGTMVATTAVASPAAAGAGVADDAGFPDAIRGIAQARMGSAKPLALGTEAALPRTGSSARSNATARESAAPIATTSASQTSTAGTIAAQEGHASMSAKAVDAEASKRTIVKGQTTPFGAPHLSKADLHKLGAGGTGDPTHLPGDESAANTAVPLGGEREAGQPLQASAGQSVLPASVSANANDPKNTREHEHSGTAKVVSPDGSSMTASRTANNPNNAVADSDAASAAANVAQVEPNGSASFKAEVSAATQATLASQVSQLSQAGGYSLSAPTGIAPNPFVNPHGAGGASKPAGLSEAGVENTGSGASLYSESLQHESHGTLVATPTTLEVGVPRGAEGWLKIRAEVGSDGISASLSTASHAGQSMLRDQLPAINAFLQGEQIHASATLLDRSTLPGASDGGSGAAFDHGPGREGSQRQFSQAHQETSELAEDSHTASLPSGFGVLLPTGSARAGASLSVLA